MFNQAYIKFERILTGLGIGMRGKLISLFVIIKVAPLFLLALMAWWQFEHLGNELQERTEILAARAKSALTETGDIAVNDAIKALDDLAREDIERMTTDVAKQVAAFLYARDVDIRHAATLPADKAQYENFLRTRVGRLVKQGEWELSPDKSRWQPASSNAAANIVSSSNKENDLNFNYRPPAGLEYHEQPLFLEMAFISPEGKELVKVVTSDRVSPQLKDISKRENTYAKAEAHFAELKKLKPGEIYVSDVIGSYVPSRLIGMYNPANASKVGIPYEPKEEAFAGKENPLGKRFMGIVRWATPVVENGRIIGYVTLALNHDHIMSFVDHVTPTRDRYTELSDAYEGNYAFIWDHKGRSVAHPRHHSIVGFHPETGEVQVPWLENKIYDRWQQSGKEYVDFIVDEPTFVEQSVTKKPAQQLTREGLVGLDCRYLNFAPQCTGWFDLTSKGGSGSFNILWSGLRKLTTAATIPYFTGQYADSPRGFGFVAVGAGLEDFHRPATQTGEVLGQLIDDTDADLKETVEGTKKVIADNLTETALSLSISTGLMMLLVILIAVWMASVFTRRITSIIKGMLRFRNGERQFRFRAQIKDEMGVLCDSFDSMAESIESSVQGTLAITDTKGIIIYANNAFLQAIKMEMSEVIGKPYTDVSLFDDDPLSKLMRHEDPTTIKQYGPLGCYYQGMAEEHKNAQGDTIGYIIISTDVTGMFEAQRKSEEQRVILDIIFSASPDYIWYKALNGTYLAVNPAFARLCGKPQDSIIGSRHSEILAPKKQQEIEEQDRAILESRKAVLTEEDITDPHGNTIVLESVRTPIFDQTGTLTGILGVARDITERTRITEELRETQRELENAVELATRANTAKGQFLANMSHEIRTPMNAILGFTYIALQDPMPQAQRSMFTKIHAAATGLLSIINDILDFSKIEARKLDLEMAPFSLVEQLCNIVDMIKIRADEKKINLYAHFSPELQGEGMLIGDAGRLRQILLNLLGNAVKFTERGGVVIEVEVLQGTPQHKTLRFSIYDTGIGIDNASIDHLFKPFSQADESITRRFGGTGLGLTICKQLVELMGGNLEVESRVGWGSCFSFTLAFECDESEQQALPAGGTVKNKIHLKGKHVLLVEDNDINQMIAENLLKQAGVEVSVASNGVEALDAVRRQSFDMVFMDIQMPLMDGLEATRRIRAMSESSKNLPIVAMTAHAMSDDHAKSLAAGMNDHITKPIDPELLYATLVRWIG